MNTDHTNEVFGNFKTGYPAAIVKQITSKEVGYKKMSFLLQKATFHVNAKLAIET